MAITTGITKSSGIYCIKNLSTDQFYIGSAFNIQRRMWKHINLLRRNEHTNQHLQNSWNKHGESTFSFFVIETCEKEILIEREQYYLDIYRPEYNKSKTAIANKGQKHSDEARKNISAGVRKWLENGGDSLRKKLSLAHSGKITSEETKQKLSRAGKKFYSSSEGKETSRRQAEKRKKVMTKEREAEKAIKIVATRRKNNTLKHSEETKQKLRNAHLGRNLSQDHKDKIGAASKKSWEKRKAAENEEN